MIRYLAPRHVRSRNPTSRDRMINSNENVHNVKSINQWFSVTMITGYKSFGPPQNGQPGLNEMTC